MKRSVCDSEKGVHLGNLALKPIISAWDSAGKKALLSNESPGFTHPIKVLHTINSLVSL